MTTRVSLMWPGTKSPIYRAATDGFVIEKEFSALLFFSSLPPSIPVSVVSRVSSCSQLDSSRPVSPFAVDPFAVISIRGKRRSGLRTSSSFGVRARSRNVM